METRADILRHIDGLQDSINDSEKAQSNLRQLEQTETTRAIINTIGRDLAQYRKNIAEKQLILAEMDARQDDEVELDGMAAQYRQMGSKGKVLKAEYHASCADDVRALMQFIDSIVQRRRSAAADLESLADEMDELRSDMKDRGREVTDMAQGTRVGMDYLDDDIKSAIVRRYEDIAYTSHFSATKPKKI